MIDFERLYKGSAYTITGTGGDIEEWKSGYQELLNKENIGTVKNWYSFSGKEMNEYYNLTSNNRYPDDLHFLSFDIEELNIGKLAIFKMIMGDRWFDDIVDNNQRRENRSK